MPGRGGFLERLLREVRQSASSKLTQVVTPSPLDRTRCCWVDAGSPARSSGTAASTMTSSGCPTPGTCCSSSSAVSGRHQHHQHRPARCPCRIWRPGRASRPATSAGCSASITRSDRRVFELLRLARAATLLARSNSVPPRSHTTAALPTWTIFSRRFYRGYGQPPGLSARFVVRMIAVCERQSRADRSSSFICRITVYGEYTGSCRIGS